MTGAITPSDFARSARSMLGVPFHLHGRDPVIGLDCVGLVAVALERAGCKARAPAGYQLRNLQIGQFLPAVREAGFLEASGQHMVGDVLLVRPSAAQYHLMIMVSSTELIHAHAGLGRVVITPAPSPWSIEQIWRLRAN